jgi:hypothetical protein
MTPGTVIYSIVGVWLFVAVIVVGYPLLSGQIRVGFDPVRRDTDPRAFWTAYLVSTALFFAVSAGLGFFVHAILPR